MEETYRVVQLYYTKSLATVAMGLTRKAAIHLAREEMRKRTADEIEDGVCYIVEREYPTNEQDDEQAKQLIAAAVLAERAGAKWFAFETAKVVGDIALILRIEREGM